MKVSQMDEVLRHAQVVWGQAESLSLRCESSYGLLKRPKVGQELFGGVSSLAVSFRSFSTIIRGFLFTGGMGSPCSFSSLTCSCIPCLAWYKQSSTECPMPEKPSKSGE